MKRRPSSRAQGISLVGLIILIGLAAVLAIGNTLFVLRQQAATRDAIRIADMARLEAAFALLSYETSSYAEAAKGCPRVNDLVSSCSLFRYLPTITSLKDPGRYRYTVKRVPDDGTFAVGFTLERGFGQYGQGSHTLSPDGIK